MGASIQVKGFNSWSNFLRTSRKGASEKKQEKKKKEKDYRSVPKPRGTKWKRKEREMAVCGGGEGTSGKTFDQGRKKLQPEPGSLAHLRRIVEKMGTLRRNFNGAKKTGEAGNLRNRALQKPFAGLLRHTAGRPLTIDLPTIGGADWQWTFGWEF